MNYARLLWGMITPTVRKLMLVVGVTSVIFNWWTLGASPPYNAWAMEWMTLHPDTIPDLRLTGLLLNSLVAAPAGFLSVLIFLAIGIFFFQGLFRTLWHTRRNELLVAGVGILLALYLVNALIVPGMGWGLAMAMMLIAWFGVAMERRWGGRRLVHFMLLIALITNTLGALFAWIAPNPTAPLLGAAVGAAPTWGIGPVITALMGAWCMALGRQRVAILNVTGRQLLIFLAVIEGLHLLLTSKLLGFMGLTALGAAWLLITGRWHPDHIKDVIKLWRLKARRKRMTLIEGGRR